MSPCRNRILTRSLIASFVAHGLLVVSTARLMPLMPGAPEAVRPAMSGRLTGNVSSAPVKQVIPVQPVVASPRKRAAFPASPSPEKILRKPDVSARPDTTTAVPSGGLSDGMAEAAKASDARASLSARPSDGPGGGVGQTVPEGRGASASPDADVQRNISADDVRQYRTALAINARRYKRYPALAREQGWEGNVEIAIDFRKAVPNPEVSLVRSSGKAVLDDQALEMIRQAARVTEMPSRLAENEFRVVLPVEFSLEEMR